MTRRISDPSRFGRVALAMGGDSAEREVSLRGGAEVLAALQRQGIDAFAVDGLDGLIVALKNGRVDRVFNLLHGRGGEDGVIQGLLAAWKIPITGCGLLASALSMDKLMAKQVWRAAGLPTPAARALGRNPRPDTLADLPLPLVVKPVHEGSSVGVVRVFEPAELEPALSLAARPDDELMAEALVLGDEYTVGLLDGQALPVIRIEPLKAFYDYEAKYTPGSTRYHIPCGLPAAREQALQQLAERAFAALGGRGWGRVDLIVDRAGQPWLLELNTTPGMTATSLLPKAAAAIGLDFDALVWRILETSFEGSAV